MSRARHLSDPERLALALRPGARVPAATRTHLERCAACHAEVAGLKALRAHLEHPPEEPSAGALMRAWALLPPAPPRPRELSRFALARLVHDSGALPAAQGLRAPLEARRLLWHIAGADLDLQLEPPGLGAPARLTGQILPRRRTDAGTRGGAIWLLERGRRARWAPVGPAGDFTLPAPRTAHALLWIEWGGVRGRVELP